MEWIALLFVFVFVFVFVVLRHEITTVLEQVYEGLDDVEYATLEYVDWFNHRRQLGMLPPNEFEVAH